MRFATEYIGVCTRANNSLYVCVPYSTVLTWFKILMNVIIKVTGVWWRRGFKW